MICMQTKVLLVGKNMLCMSLYENQAHAILCETQVGMILYEYNDNSTYDLYAKPCPAVALMYVGI